MTWRTTQTGPRRPLLSLSGRIGGGDVGPPGSVPTSNGSNGVAWASNVQLITVNQTTKVLGPFVNFADGSNTTVTVDQNPGSTPSNTIRIHSTGGGAAFGSNSTHVSETTQVGASSNTARADHYHRGIETITASSSNTMQRGTWNLRPGVGIHLSLTDTDGDGEFDTTTIVNTGSGGGGGGGGGSFTEVQAYIWAVGASTGFLTPCVRCSGSGTLNARIHVSVSGAVFVNLMKNGVRQEQQTASSTGTYTFTGISVAAGDQVYIAMSSGGTAFPDNHADNVNALSLSAGMTILGGPVAGMAIA